ncbi:MAG: phosphoserine phosphatase SerB [Nitrososphaerota archaeon]|nr:phosphoserine phosphatase SerB [Nitrososphaerota archaeon]MDG6911890.1 phosphoserine phosphatase SerB [Nitrososphaerota archaeon]MDG6924443.1 phosphoserine phosphatase SerB [Nitrososphaerota archaeon]MDG6941105.1 phosphoserine phosphatase SerB [Nitrososphaerota archaeon]MDG6945724.1 phosphoserine phosphatase SerB [Nitrososphaerota archaeon]
MIIIFDVEGVLVDGEFLPELARLVGKEKEVHEITRKGISGEMNWEQSLQKRIELLRGLPLQVCVSISERLPSMKGAQEMVRKLKEMSALRVGVSGGFSLLANRVKAELDLDHVFSNELIFHEGRLIGYGLLVSSNKAQILNTAFGDMLKDDKKVAVVDGANDLDLFNLVDLKIAFNVQEIVRQRADVVVDGKDLSEILKIVAENFREEAPDH